MNESIRVVTDSGSDLSRELCEEYGIAVVPLTITFGSHEYRDGVDLCKDEFFRMLEEGDALPFTTQPSPAEFAATYQRLRDEGAKHVISVHLSSKLSGTHQSAMLGAREVEGLKVHVVDSHSASLGIGLLAIEAVKAIRNGAGVEEAVEHVHRMRERLRVYFYVDTLEYLARNGRIGKAQALVGSMLNIKPVLTIEDGVVAPHAKVRGKRKALQLVTDSVKQQVGDKPFTAAIVHGDMVAEAEAMKEELLAAAPGSDVSLHKLGPTIGTHTGPATLGVVAFAP